MKHSENPIPKGNSKPSLKLDWCSRSSAEMAVMRWHYSKALPNPKSVYIGVWENARFIGVVIFGIGGGNATNGEKYGLSRFEMAELERVALDRHNTPVSRIVSVAIRMLKKQSPKLKCLISYADPAQNHHGGIYQAMNWVYTGTTPPGRGLKDSRGKIHHSRVVSDAGVNRQFGSMKKVRTWNSGTKIILPGKHRYLLALDDETRSRIEKLRKPYPKRAGSETVDTSGDQPEKGGSIPTPALQTL